MSAAVAEAMTDVPKSVTANVVPLPPTDTIDGTPLPQEIREEARVGAQKILQMSPDELRGLIAKRVKMLDTELKEREARRAAIEEFSGRRSGHP